MSTADGCQDSSPAVVCVPDDDETANQTCYYRLKFLGSAVKESLLKFLVGAEVTPIIAEHGVFTITGKKSSDCDWINQDNYVVVSGVNHPVQCFILFDGHGSNGHLVSERCREMLPKYLEGTNYDSTKAFEKMHNDLESSGFDTSCSGTTCVAVLIDSSNKLMVASVGDSRAILGVKRSTSYIPVKLNPEHKPGDPPERKRIEAAGGSVCVRHKGADPSAFPDGGPLRVWSRTGKGTYSGLCMSRSLGDILAHGDGVVHVPFRDIYPLEEGDDFVVIASDGVWDMLSNRAVLDIATECIVKGRRGASGTWDPQDVSETIAKAARTKWEKDHSRIDDITCLVVKLSQ